MRGKWVPGERSRGLLALVGDENGTRRTHALHALPVGQRACGRDREWGGPMSVPVAFKHGNDTLCE